MGLQQEIVCLYERLKKKVYAAQSLCGMCGERLREEAEFCVHCGTKRGEGAFNFYALLPLVIVGMGWEKFWIFLPAKAFGYISPIPELEVVLDFASAFCEPTLFLAVVVTMASIVALAYGILVNSNIHLNRICGVVCILCFLDCNAVF